MKSSEFNPPRCACGSREFVDVSTASTHQPVRLHVDPADGSLEVIDHPDAWDIGDGGFRDDSVYHCAVCHAVLPEQPNLRNWGESELSNLELAQVELEDLSGDDGFAIAHMVCSMIVDHAARHPEFVDPADTVRAIAEDLIGRGLIRIGPSS